MVIPQPEDEQPRSGLIAGLLEHQISIYLLALAAGIGSAIVIPASAQYASALLTPSLIVLLVLTFLELPLYSSWAQWLRHHRKSSSARQVEHGPLADAEATDDLILSNRHANIRFLAWLLAGNFFVVPVVVFALTHGLLGAYHWFFAAEATHRTDADSIHAILFGFVIVLLCPCIDYVLVFSHVSGGDTPRLTMATPLLLFTQFLLLPLYFRILFQDFSFGLSLWPFLWAFCCFVVVPVILAFLLQAWHASLRGPLTTTKADVVRYRSSNPVALLLGNSDAIMLLAMVFTLWCASTSAFATVRSHSWELSLAAAGYALFVGIVATCLLAALGVAHRLGYSVPKNQQVSIVFSCVTRNSLVLLPLVLALPNTTDLTAAAILTQTLVELLCLIFLIRVIPRFLRLSPSR